MAGVTVTALNDNPEPITHKLSFLTSGYPHAAALHQFSSSFPPLPSIVRSPQATTAAAAAAAQVAAAAAAGVNPMIMDPRFISALQQQGAMGVGGKMQAGKGVISRHFL